MSEDDNQVPSALVAVGTKALAVRSESLIKRGLALAKSLQPGDAAAHDKLGLELYKKGDLDGAIAEYRTAIRFKLDYAQAHYHLGHALRKKGDLDGAIAEYRTVVRLQPEDADAHYFLGSALHDKGDLDGAIAEFRTADRKSVV